MQPLDYHNQIGQLIHIYDNFPLPVAIYNRELQQCWCNALTKAYFPALSSATSISALLAEYDPAELSARLMEEGCCFIADALPMTGFNLCIQPAPTGHGGNLILMAIRGGAPPDSHIPVLTGGTAASLSQGIRKAVANIFDTMDNTSLKADLLHAGWIKPSLGQIRIESYGLLRIAENISEYTRLLCNNQIMTMEALDLTELLSEMEYLVTEIGRGLGIPIHFHLPGVYCVMNGDRSFLELALFNVLHNSLYFTRAGNQIHVYLSEEGDWISLTVEDRGAGIPAHILPSIWDPYFSYDHNRTGAGIGLGLTLVRAIVGLHSGGTSAQSDTQGTRVRMRFPKARFTDALSLGRGERRGHLNDRFSRLYVGLTDAADSPYRHVQP